MVESKVLCIAVAFVVFAVSGASALLCYRCDTGHVGCADPFNNTNIEVVNCSDLFYSSRADEFGFRATSLDVLTEDYSRASENSQYECYAYHRVLPSNFTEVLRGCRILENTDLCATTINATIGSGINVTNCYTCQSDYCNEAHTINSALLLVLLSSALALIYNKF